VANQQTTGTTTLVSANATGLEGNLSSFSPSISTDGRLVAYRSNATNLVAGGTNGLSHVYVYDWQTGQTSLISSSPGQVQGDRHSALPAISPDGRYVAFESLATNLVPGGTNGKRHIFVRDRETDETSLCSQDADGVQGNDDSSHASISADGSRVAFASRAAKLVAGGTNGESHIFVRLQGRDATILASVDNAGVQGNGGSFMPSISADGRYVAFHSWATNLVPGGTPANIHVYVRDLATRETTLVSKSSGGMLGNDVSTQASITAGGRYVAFDSLATNLVTGGTNGKRQVFVHDRQSGQTSLASADSSGAEGNDDSSLPSISADGRYVAYESKATNLVPGGMSGVSHIYVHDRVTGETELISVGPVGVLGNANSHEPFLSASGRYVAFRSKATNLAAGTANGYFQIFVHDRWAQIHLPLVVK
jgi:Tol biopolymer transport system component